MMVSDENRVLFYFFTVIENMNITLSILTNLVLIMLILARSSREIGAYRFLLLAFAANDTYFPIVHALTLPVICSYKDAFIMFSQGFLTSSFSACLFATAFGQTMPLLAHLFIYRTIATKWPRHLSFYTTRSCCLLVIGSLVVTLSPWSLNCYFNYAPDEEFKDYAQPFFDEEFNGEQKDFIGALYFNNKGEFRSHAFLTTMGFDGMMATSLSIIVFCSFAIVGHFRSTQIEWSGATKKLQQQLFHTLFVQMIIPMMFVYFPCAAIINLPMLGFRINVFPNLVSADELNNKFTEEQ